MTTPDDGSAMGERLRPGVGRRERAVAAPGAGAGAGPATVPGLVVTEERLVDGRAITYFDVVDAGAAR